MSSSKTISLGETTLQLNPDLSANMGDRVLMIADVHIGKTMHFRKNGLGVPAQIAQKELDNLSLLLDSHQPEELIILGDLFHSKPNKEWDLFEKWIAQYNETLFKLIIGNHDNHVDKLELSKISRHASIELSGVTLQHHPPETPLTPTICGHIHPAFRLKGASRQSLKLPCFHLNENTLTLPSFGRFTGSYSLKPVKGDSIFMSTGTSIEKLDF